MKNLSFVIFLIFLSCSKLESEKPASQVVLIQNQVKNPFVYNGKSISSENKLRDHIREFRRIHGEVPVLVKVEESLPFSRFTTVAEILNEELMDKIYTSGLNSAFTIVSFQELNMHFQVRAFKWDERLVENKILLSLPKEYGINIEVVNNKIFLDDSEISLKELKNKVNLIANTNRNIILLTSDTESTYSNLHRLLKVFKQYSVDVIFVIDPVLEVFDP